MAHVALGTTTSPYISLTRSYGVARDYALNSSRARPTASRPAYVYEIDISDPPPATLPLFDPVVQVAASLGSPTSAISYHHNGAQAFILGVVDPKAMSAFRWAATPHPPGAAPTPGPANLTRQLETMVRGLRDAEVLVMGNLPAVHVVYRHSIY